VTAIYQLEAYADESGTHDPKGQQKGSEVVAVVGYLNPKANWDRLSRRWTRRLKEFNAPPVFHMREFKNDSPYNSWTQLKRDRFETKLIKLARDETWFAIGAAVSVRDYEEVVPKWLKDEDQHPYFFCFRLFLDALLDIISKDIDRKFKTKKSVACIFDQKPEFQPQAIKTFNAIKKLRDPDDRLSSLTFGSRKQYVPLQAADLMAYYGRRILTHMMQGKAWRDPMERLLEERNSLMIYTYPRSSLIKWVDDVTMVRNARLARGMQ